MDIKFSKSKEIKMYDLQCSTPSLTLNDSSASSLVESIASRHSYNTRLSAKLKANKSKTSICSKNLSKKLSIAESEKTIVDVTDLTLLNSQTLVTKSKFECDCSNWINKIMRRGYPRPVMTCGTGPSCMERVCRCLIYFVAVGCLVIICTFLVQNLQKTQGSYQCFSQELNKIKLEMANMKSEVQDVFASRDDTEKKLEVIEELLRDLKKSQKMPSTNKCPLKQNPNKPTSIRKEIAEALNLYADDKTGKTDFALESAGGSILEVRDTESFPTAEKIRFWGVVICSKANSARAILQPGTLPGECWAFKGSRGCAIIQLLGKVRITGVSMEHITTSMSPSGEITTAPKDFTIKGLSSIDDAYPTNLGKFTYDINGTRLQYFEINNCEKAYHLIEFRVLSNHGHPDFTCVYRLRVHGELQG